MLFRLKNAAQTFKRFINEILHGLDFCYAYIDDLLIASKMEEEHIKHLRELFTRIHTYSVKITSAKCVFEANQVTFLRYLVSSEGTKSLPEKIIAIQNVPKPENIKQM